MRRPEIFVVDDGPRPFTAEDNERLVERLRALEHEVARTTVGVFELRQPAGSLARAEVLALVTGWRWRPLP